MKFFTFFIVLILVFCSFERAKLRLNCVIELTDKDENTKIIFKTFGDYSYAEEYVKGYDEDDFSARLIVCNSVKHNDYTFLYAIFVMVFIVSLPFAVIYRN